MSLAWATRAAGRTLGALALGAAVLVPASVPDGLVPLLLGAPAPEVEPGPPGLVERVDERLGARMPDYEQPERRELARTLVVESERARIDPLLVLAVIEVESSYDPDARSERGAHGLMQLRRLLDAFGREEHALMAYNAGPNRILGYLREGDDIPERFRVYPRKIRAEVRKLRRSWEAPRAAAVAVVDPVPVN